MNTTTSEKFVKEGLEQPARRGMLRACKGNRFEGRVPAYYCESYGKGLLPTLLDMIRTRTDKEILRDKCTSDTLYQRVQQSFAYCIDKLDEGGVLENLRQQVMIRRTPKGVVICFLENADRYAKQVFVHNVVARTDAFHVRDAISVNWREAVHNFIEHAEQRELKLTDGFAITPAEVNEIKALIEQIGRAHV